MIQVLSNILLYLCPVIIIASGRMLRLAWLAAASTPLAIVVLVVIVRLSAAHENELRLLCLVVTV